jgi:hypothetical protein
MMKELTSAQLGRVYGAAQGAFHFNGANYPFEVPEVTQGCLTTYLSYFNGVPTGAGVPIPILEEVFEVCTLANIDSISGYLEPILDGIRANYRI